MSLVAVRAPKDASHWKELNPCPERCLCHNPSRRKVRPLVGEHVEHPWAHHGVYVLECRQTSATAVERVRIRKGNQQFPCSRDVFDANRIFYVGVSKQVAERVYLHSIGSGATFTEAFPPVRIVDVTMYNSLAESYRAEERTARLLNDRYPDTYVFQR
jgi:hypothetical protein